MGVTEDYSQKNRSSRWAFLAVLQIVLPPIIIGIYLLIISDASTRLFRDYGLSQHKTSVIRVVSMAYNAIQPTLEEIRQGKLDEREGLARVRDMLHNMTYQDDGGQNYLFLLSNKGMGLAHPFEPQLEGVDRWNEYDAQGKYYIREIVQTALANPQGGFVTYLYPLPNSSALMQKISYVISIPELHAVLGTGIYLDIENKEQSQVIDNINGFLFVLVGLIAATSLFSVYQITKSSRRLAGEISEREKAQWNTQISEQNLRVVFDNIYDAIIIHDTEGKVMQVNQRGLELFGLPADHAGILTIYDISEVADASHNLLKDCWQRVQKGQEVIFEWRGRRWGSLDLFDVDVVLRPILWNGKKMILSVMRDIRERKKNEQAIIDSERKYRLLTENMRDVIWQVDAELRFTYLSPSVERIFGYSPGEFIGRQVWKLVTPQHVERIRQELDRYLVQISGSREGGAVFELEAKHKNGSTIWCGVNVSPIFDENRRLVGLQGVTRDITNRKKQQELLEHSEERLRSLMENSKDGINLFDEQGRAIEWNAAAENITGIPRSEAMGQYLWDIIWRSASEKWKTPAWHEYIKKEINETLQTGKPLFKRTEEVDFTLPDGSSRIVLQNLFPIKTVQGYRLGGILHDITERKKAEMLHMESEERFRSVVEQLAEGLILVDQNGLIIYWNKAFEEMVGIPRANAIGRFAWDVKMETLIPDQKTPEKAEQIIKEIQAVLNGMDTTSMEKSTRMEFTSNRRQKVLEQTTFRIHTPLGNLVAAIVRDVTEQHKAQQKIEHELMKIESLRQIDAHIIAQSPLEESMNAVVLQGKEHLRADGFNLLLLDEDGKRLKVVASAGLTYDVQECPHFADREGPGWSVVHSKRMIRYERNKDAHILHNCDCFQNEQFETYIGVPITSKHSLVGVMEGFLKEGHIIDQDWINYLETLAGQAAIAYESHRLLEHLEYSNQQLSEAYDATIAGWSKALELRDKETKGHSERVMELACKLAIRLGFSEEEMTHFRRGVLLHDIGKMGIPDNILLKPAPLSDEEWLIMKQHPVFAYDLLSPIAYLRPALDVAYAHHERWDGSGYPRALKGEEIPLAARIFSVVDVWDALISDRPYRQAWDSAEVKKYLITNRGVLFDPQVVDVFLEIVVGD